MTKASNKNTKTATRTEATKEAKAMNKVEPNRQEIEEQLSQIVTIESRSWTAVYLLMKKVQDDKLYLPEYKSFEAWVNDLSKKTMMHVSNLWQYLDAGRFYDSYATNAIKRGVVVPTIENLCLPAGTVGTIMDIMKGNPDLKSADSLVHKVLAGNATRYDFKDAKRRAEKEMETKELSGKRTRTSSPRSRNTGEMKKKPKFPVTAKDIFATIKTSNDWFNHTGCTRELSRKSRKQEHKYFVDGEVAAHTGGINDSARRIDAVAVENYSVRFPSDLTVRGIEIKVNRNDLLTDHKMAEYTDFVDYFYIAVPDFLVDDALSVCLPEWGILSISLDTGCKKSGTGFVVSLVKSAERLDGIMREQTLAQILFKRI